MSNEHTLISLIIVLTILVVVQYIENRELRKEKSKMAVNKEGELIEVTNKI